jgi:hypothetical protein
MKYIRPCLDCGSKGTFQSHSGRINNVYSILFYKSRHGLKQIHYDRHWQMRNEFEVNYSEPVKSRISQSRDMKAIYTYMYLISGKLDTFCHLFANS